MEDRNGRRLNASTTASLRPYVVKMTIPSSSPAKHRKRVDSETKSFRI